MNASLDPHELVPHRAPILCLDRFSSAEPTRAEAEAVVQAGPHAPGGLLWEGALIEGLAQTAAALHARAGLSSRPLLTGLHELELGRSPRVGERVVYRVELTRRLPPVVLVRGVASVEGEEVARGELAFYVPGAA